MPEGEEHQGEREWVASLPEDVQGWDEVTNSDSPEKFWKQVSDMRSHIGSSIRIPGEDAGDDARKVFLEKLQNHVPELMMTPNWDDPEAMDGVLKALGRPDKVEDYKMPDDMDTAGIEIDQQKVDAFLPLFHRIGLTQKQADALIRAAVEQDVTSSLSMQKAQKADQEALQDEWGVRYDQRRDVVLSLAKATKAPEPLVKAIQSGNADSATLKWLFSLTKQLTSDGKEILDQEGSSGGMSPEEAQAKITEIMSNKQHPYWEGSHPRHEHEIKRMTDLRRIASGGK